MGSEAEDGTKHLEGHAPSLFHGAITRPTKSPREKNGRGLSSCAIITEPECQSLKVLL
jgi:hypothetical protein